MANPTYQDNVLLQEWAPLTTLLEKIPATIQVGLFTQNINFTCIDITSEFIAVGTNHGVVYWFNRKTEEIQTLGCQNTNCTITCIRVVSTVDYMVAAGNNHGVVTIFQVPKQIPDFLPEIWKPIKKKQVERFNISGLHGIAITAVEWSKNGMKLFSGDQNGVIVLTEIDFYMHLSKSTEFLNEKYSIVQLSHQNGLLLISTLFRTIIVDGNNHNKIIQVGQKERKMLGTFGAVFFKNKNLVQEPIIYANRPGLRIWQADKNGIVLKTLILKNATKVGQTQVKLLNPVSDYSKKKVQENPIFGIILPFSNDLLVTYNQDLIYFVNPNTNIITSIITNLRKVTDIACFEDEIFILEGERNILRIAHYPELTAFNTGKNQSTGQLTLFSKSNDPVNLGFVDLGTKIKLNAIMPTFSHHKVKHMNIIQAISILPSVVIGIDTTSTINVDEAVEVSANVPIKLDSHLVTGIDLKLNQSKNYEKDKRFYSDRKDIFQKIGEQEFEEIVFTSQRKDNKMRNETNKIAQKSQMKMVIRDKSTSQVNNVLVESKNSFQLIKSIDTEDILESINNLESIQKSIQDKEKLLFNYLNLDLSININTSQICNIKSNPCTSIDNEYKNNISYSYTIDKKCESLISESVEQKSKNCKTKLIKFDEVNHYKYNKKHLDIKQACINKADLKNRKISEIQFNALSKEFVKSVIYQDNDDWILLG